MVEIPPQYLGMTEYYLNGKLPTALD